MNKDGSIRGQIRKNVIHPWIARGGAVEVEVAKMSALFRCRLCVGVPHANMTLMMESTSNNLHPSQRAYMSNEQ